MTRRRRIWTAARTRRTVQTACLLLFFGLLLAARPSPEGEPGPLVKLFFLIDPLILLVTLLAAHAVLALALWSLVVVAVTTLFGRVFCGWVCPLGTLHAIAGRFLRRKSRPGDGVNHWSRWQLAKYYLLVGFLVMALFRVAWVCVLDPIVLLYRSTTTAVLPAVQWAVEEGSTAIYHFDPAKGPAWVQSVTVPSYKFLRDNASEPVYAYCRDHVFVVPKQAFLGGGLILALFIGTLLLNAWRRRFWCRYLCPLGALLGIVSRRPLLRRAVDEESCNQCDLCGMACHGAAARLPGDQWKPSECLGCLNCTDSCSRGSLRFRWAWPWRKKPAVEGIDLSRRAALGAAVGGLVALPLLRFGPQARGKTYHPGLVRPPGARPEPEFLQRCTACGMCMKICPTGGLQPTLTEAGLEGIWTPRLVPKIGYCQYECNLCGQVCPTEAIQPLTVEEKQAIKIGVAVFDTSRCIPYAFGRDCLVCEEHCPIPDKAIYFVEMEVRDHEGQARTIKHPRVDPDRCTGCGVCENTCPYKDLPAIRVTSANESRHVDNQPILPLSDWDDPY
ncbi:MAG: 4Fe-4S binding protein [Planctomycetota bacterium]|jgi:polyferredoxin/formate hydrogenlyase subunit 6/NADH:ubiquinone oxidoreductase subunit I